MLAAALVALAHAGAVAFFPEGEPTAGQRAAVELVLWDEPALTGVSARAGEILGWEGGEGRYVLDYRAPLAGTGERLVVALDGGRTVTLSLAAPLAPVAHLRVAPVISGNAGPGARVVVRVEGEDLPPPDELAVAVPEGRIVAVTAAPGALEIVFEPSDLREPRAIPLGVRDARYPAIPPAWTVVRLSARAPIDVKTEPGTSLTVNLGGRTYGPSVARADGRASVTIEVRPGESSAEATLQDALGNRQASSIALLRSPRPSLAMLAEGPLVPGLPGPRMYLRALDEAGRPWSGAPPSCGSNAGPLGSAEVQDAGVYVLRLLSGPPAVGDVLVECTLGDGLARGTARVAVVQDRPTRVVLQVWPEELTGDLPVAQVRASLESARGERLPPEGLTLNADRGVLVALPSEDQAIYAEYHGDPKNAEDTIRAERPAVTGSGPPWTLTLRHTAGGVEALVLDRVGRPLEGQPVVFSGPSGAVSLRTDGEGVARATGLQAGLVRAETGTLHREIYIREGEVPLAPFSRLLAERPISIRAGRIQRVSVRMDPPEIYTGEEANLRVRLEDAAGLPITDEPVTVTAQLGQLSDLVVGADGTLVARYTPPPGLLAEEIEIGVRSATGAFPETSASLILRPRPLSWSPGFGAGVVASLGRPATPYGDLRVDLALPQLPSGIFYGRVAVGYLRQRDEVVDSSRGSTVSLRMDMVPVSAAILARRELGLWSSWVGLGVNLTPYRLEATFADDVVLRGPGLHRPGGQLYAGGARRLMGGEAFAELMALSVVARNDPVGYEGQVGGMAILLGYRVVY